MSARKVDVGTPPIGFQEWETIEVRFHDFDSLPVIWGECSPSPEFTCFGRQWRVVVFPGGVKHPYPEDAWVAASLKCFSKETIKVEYILTARHLSGELVNEDRGIHSSCSGCRLFGDSIESPGLIHSDLCKRLDIANRVHATLIVEVRMRPSEPTSMPTPKFAPQNPFCKNMLKLFMDEESADVVIKVGGKQDAEGTRKRARTPSSSFPAHRIVLKKCAPALAEMCGSSGEVTIPGVDPDIFRLVLSYVYGGGVPDGDVKSRARDIIDVADKLGAVGLKLEAEKCYVDSTVISVDNVVDCLLYADGRNCALLKEAAMDFVAENGRDLLKCASLKDMPGGMFADLLTATTRAMDGGESDGDVSTMRVDELRCKLAEKGLDVDGSREAMIAALKENSRGCAPERKRG